PHLPDIKVTTENVRNGVVITVSDKGLGISKDTINKVFEKFYRVPTGNVHDVKGFGLGLSYVKAMIEAHFGNISVQSELGKGSDFSIFLPFKHEPQEG
ncbi:MAG: ATP-binding protein, partial [Thermoflexibacter sp.]|nr:ATP-binding protein [Thermoflexibacter sp.]